MVACKVSFISLDYQDFHLLEIVFHRFDSLEQTPESLVEVAVVVFRNEPSRHQGSEFIP